LLLPPTSRAIFVIAADVLSHLRYCRRCAEPFSLLPPMSRAIFVIAADEPSHFCYCRR
jgi:hypothetical protein